MEHAPSLDGIGEQLSRAVKQFMSFLRTSEQVTCVPRGNLQIERAVKNMVERQNEWLVAVPAFSDMQNWVEVHWNVQRRTQPPIGTLSIGDAWGNQGEVQLDALAATCKLLLAAAGYGAETVAKYAMEFAGHGMIEVRSFYLLKGLPESNTRPLDRYCTLFPYREALQKVNAAASAQKLEVPHYWPPESADNVCMLEAIGFEHRGLMADEFERCVSPLLQCGVDTLVLILGLVWGKGFRVFGVWHSVAEPISATLPFFRTTSYSSSRASQTLLTVPGFRNPSTNRPLNNKELAELIGKYAALSERAQCVLNLALRRLRDSTERIAFEDKVVDVGIVLEALFMEEGEYRDQRRIISRRGSWYFADSCAERDQTRDVLKAFYKHRSEIVHGDTSANLMPEEGHQCHKQVADLLATVENVVRASLKTMISEGRPQNWKKSKDTGSIRYDPPRPETTIPSVKSESLSWSVKEQKAIDQALEAVWKPEVDNTSPLSPDMMPVTHQGVNAEEIKWCRQQGVPYVISVPIRLYMAHPKWPKQEGDPVDERTKYYCEKDVERHLRRWGKAASEKRMYRFVLPLEDPAMYLPKAFDMWHRILQQGQDHDP